MMYALALAAALAPAQAGDLKLTNVRMTIGELGPHAPRQFLPGDILFVGYDITGLSIEPDGLAKYTMSMEVSTRPGSRSSSRTRANSTTSSRCAAKRFPARGVRHHRPRSGPRQLLVQGHG